MPDAANLQLYDLIEAGYELTASDVMLKVGHKPMMKQYSAVKPLPGDWPVLYEEDIMRLLGTVMTERMKRKYEDTGEMDLAFELKGKARVRTNVYRQRG